MDGERFQLPGCLNSPLGLHWTRLSKGGSSSPVRLGPKLWHIALERNRLWLARLSCGIVSQVCDFFISRAGGPYFLTYWNIIFSSPAFNKKQKMEMKIQECRVNSSEEMDAHWFSSFLKWSWVSDTFWGHRVLKTPWNTWDIETSRGMADFGNRID